jgi:hypothetical protein
MSVGLAMTACATFIPTKVNAATLTVVPGGTIPKNPGDSIEFIFSLNPGSTSFSVLFLDFIYQFDGGELSQPLGGGVQKAPFGTPVNGTTTVGRVTFDVITPVKDGMSDLFSARAFYLEGDVLKETSFASGGDVVPVPEPVTIFGTVTALGCGTLFKRKFSKRRQANP